MKQYLNIPRNPIYVSMKTILHFIPIGIITNTIYISRYGEYIFSLKKENIISNFSIESTLFTIIVFIILSFISYFTETFILPEAVFIGKGFKTDLNKNKVDKILKRKYGFNPFIFLKKELPNLSVKYEILVEAMYWPVLLILYLIAFNLWYLYIIAFIVFCLTIFFGRLLISVFEEYKY